MRSHRRRGPLRHVLVAADADDLGAVAAVLALLPEDSYGQVYVETPADAVLPDLEAPARVTVNRLPRAADDEPGRLLSGAVAGWVAEWAPDEHDVARDVTLWVGASARERLDPVDARLLPL